MARDLKKLRKAIGELFRKRQALNISAVRQSHPELLEQAFAMQPFLGWKGALEAAEISYSQINVEIQEVVPCLICGRVYGSLVRPLASTHGATCEEYLEEHAGAETVRRIGRLPLSERNKRLRAIKPRHDKMVCNSSELGSWKVVFHKAGLPSVFEQKYPDLESAIKAMRKRTRAGLGTSSGEVQYNGQITPSTGLSGDIWGLIRKSMPTSEALAQRDGGRFVAN